MPLTIPCRADLTHYEMVVDLDDLSLSLEFTWNDREEAWYLDVRTEGYDPTQVPSDSNFALLEGRKIVVDSPLTRRGSVFRSGIFGELFAVDTSGAHADPEKNDLGDRVQLIYVTHAELIGFLAGIPLDEIIATTVVS